MYCKSRFCIHWASLDSDRRPLANSLVRQILYVKQLLIGKGSLCNNKLEHRWKGLKSQCLHEIAYLIIPAYLCGTCMFLFLQQVLLEYSETKSTGDKKIVQYRFTNIRSGLGCFLFLSIDILGAIWDNIFNLSFLTLHNKKSLYPFKCRKLQIGFVFRIERQLGAISSDGK